MNPPTYNYSLLSPNQLLNNVLPPQIVKHYVQYSSNQYLTCRYCEKQFFNRGNSSIQQMIWHTQTTHNKHITSKRYTLEEKMDNLKPPPKYLNKYQHLSIISDRWVDRLILDGYPINKISASIFSRLSRDSQQFIRQAQRRTNALISAKDAIIDYLPKIPLYYLPQDVISQISRRFEISPEGASLFMRRYTWPFLKAPEMYRKLQDLNVRIRRYRDGFGVDTVVVVANERMVQYYKRYGQAVNLQFRFVPLKRANSGMHYNIGLFLGQDTNLNPIIFSIALINGYHFENVKRSIQFFLQIMNHRQPQIFITDHSRMMQQILLQIKAQRKYNFKHVVNWYYTMQKLKIQLANQYQYKITLSKLSSALSSISLQQFNNIMNQIRTAGNISVHNFKQFMVNSYKCCICKVQPVFLGFGVQQDRVINVSKSICQNFAFHTKPGMFFTLAFRLQQIYNSISQNPVTYMHLNKMGGCKVKQVLYLSRVLQKNIFVKLYYLYNRSLTELQIVYKSRDNLTYIIQDLTKPSKNKYLTPVRYSIESNRWYCSCLLIYCSGIPCEHLIKIIRFFEGSISYYVNSRWLVNMGQHRQVPAFEQDQMDNVKWIDRQLLFSQQICVTQIKNDRIQSDEGQLGQQQKQLDNDMRHQHKDKTPDIKQPRQGEQVQQQKQEDLVNQMHNGVIQQIKHQNGKQNIEQSQLQQNQQINKQNMTENENKETANIIASETV